MYHSSMTLTKPYKTISGYLQQKYIVVVLTFPIKETKRDWK